MKTVVMGAVIGLASGLLITFGLALGAGDNEEIGDSYVGMAIVGTGFGLLTGGMICLLRPRR